MWVDFQNTNEQLGKEIIQSIKWGLPFEELQRILSPYKWEKQQEIFNNDDLSDMEKWSAANAMGNHQIAITFYEKLLLNCPKNTITELRILSWLSLAYSWIDQEKHKKTTKTIIGRDLMNEDIWVEEVATIKAGARLALGTTFAYDWNYSDAQKLRKEILETEWNSEELNSFKIKAKECIDDLKYGD